MQGQHRNLLLRDDTFFGVCQGLGEDLGIHPNLLRAGLALGLFWEPMVVAGVYAGMAVFVLALRLLVPNPRRKAAAAQPVAVDLAPALHGAAEQGPASTAAPALELKAAA